MNFEYFKSNNKYYEIFSKDLYLSFSGLHIIHCLLMVLDYVVFSKLSSLKKLHETTKNAIPAVPYHSC